MRVIGINIQGLRRWLWFDLANVKEEGGRFEGRDGWGTDKAGDRVQVVSINVPLFAVEGRIEFSREECLKFALEC